MYGGGPLYGHHGTPGARDTATGMTVSGGKRVILATRDWKMANLGYRVWDNPKMRILGCGMAPRDTYTSRGSSSLRVSDR